MIPEVDPRIKDVPTAPTGAPQGEHLSQQYFGGELPAKDTAMPAAFGSPMQLFSQSHDNYDHDLDDPEHVQQTWDKAMYGQVPEVYK